MLNFIVNPCAGGANGKKIKRALKSVEETLKVLKTDYVINFTHRPKHAIEITDTLIKNGATDIVVMGGDGTIHEVLNGFSEFDKVNLGIIPCGTGNDFANALKLPTDPVKALNIVLDGKTRYVDFMQMPTVRGLNIIGMGVDVAVLKRYETAKRKTKFQYTKCLIKTLFDFDYSEFDVELDGKEKTRYRSIIACFANGYRYGGGIKICPVADATDKTLNFVAINEVKGLKMVKAFLKLKKGKILDVPQTVHDTFKTVKLSCDGHYTVQVDGQLYEDIPVEIKIVSDTLKIYC